MSKGTLAIVTLGCKVNQFESEAMASAMEGEGWKVVPFGLDVDCTIINTCVVTARAEADSRRWIHRARRAMPNSLLLVTGCYPQIDPVAHNPTVPCMTCHDPHAPEPPVIPGECRACHGQIASQKAVSHHAALPCLTCHEAPDEHKLTPRVVRPGKPDSREFCGGCHAAGAASPAYVPRIEISSHGEDYLCWQCHYPHHPEAK